MSANKKCVVIFVAVAIILLVLLFPVRVALKDGGTIEYNAIVYSFVNRHSLAGEEGNEGFIKGKEIYIFGIKVFDNTEFVPIEGS